MLDQESANILFAEAEKLNLNPQRLGDYGFFAISTKGRRTYVFYSNSQLNSHLASTIARNKHLTRLVLEDAGFNNIPFNLPANQAEAEAFLAEHKKIIAKPTLGSHSRDIFLIEQPEQFSRVKLDESILEKFIEGTEMRVLFLGEQILAVHQKDYPGPINDPGHDLKRISYSPQDWDEALNRTALAVARAVGLTFGTVDFIVAPFKNYILEVNAAPGLTWFHQPSSGPAVNVARELLLTTIARLS